MARWIRADIAAKLLGIHRNQIAVDHYHDKKVGWKKRIKKGEDGRLYANVDDYRSSHLSNALTKVRIERLYFELRERYEEGEIVKMLIPFLPPQSDTTTYMYFKNFSFGYRRVALKYYHALKALKRSLAWQNTPMTPSINAA